MAPTLNEGDQVVIENYSDLNSIERQDVISFVPPPKFFKPPPEYQEQQHKIDKVKKVIKRVVGLSVSNH